MNKIAVYTAARSDYGPLKNVIRKLNQQFDLDLIVGGTHLSKSSGFTYKEIMEDNLVNSSNIIEVEFLLDSSTPQGLSKSVGLEQTSMAQILNKKNYEGIVILGDRYELFGISIPAMFFSIPLFHISGGEITEGVIDENIRHSHTKLANIHLVANEEYARNVSQMGEEDWRIAIVGECGLDNIYNVDYVSKSEIKRKFNIDLKKETFLITFYPSTLDSSDNTKGQIKQLLKGVKSFDGYQKIFTAPRLEEGSEIIINEINKFVNKNEDAIFVNHLGSRNYLTILKNSEVVIGNSSSGLVEAPSFKVPTVNIGDRQKNRLKSKSVINTECKSNKIKKSINKALTSEIQELAQKAKNPYDPYRDGKNSSRIAYVIKRTIHDLSKQKLMRKKFNTDIQNEQWNYLLEGF